MQKYFLGVDIGGSHISCAPVDTVTGEILDGRVYKTDVDSNSSCATIIGKWKNHIKESIAKIGGDIQGVGLAVPGPFDEKRGISMIAGVKKFDSLFGLNNE